MVRTPSIVRCTSLAVNSFMNAWIQTTETMTAAVFSLLNEALIRKPKKQNRFRSF